MRTGFAGFFCLILTLNIMSLPNLIKPYFDKLRKIVVCFSEILSKFSDTNKVKKEAGNLCGC